MDYIDRTNEIAKCIYKKTFFSHQFIGFECTKCGKLKSQLPYDKDYDSCVQKIKHPASISVSLIDVMRLP